MNMHDCLGWFASLQKRGERTARWLVPEPLGAEPGEGAGGENVVVSEERDRDARVVQALIHGTDGGEEIDLRAAPRQPLRALDGDLGLAAIDMRVVADDDDAHGAAYLIAIT